MASFVKPHFLQAVRWVPPCVLTQLSPTWASIKGTCLLGASPGPEDSPESGLGFDLFLE